MRLTLRTLLAWLDGVLRPEEAEELAAKVEASPVAPRLVERIQGVVARPALPAPRTAGRGLGDDANTVAEYLDNVLPGDRLEAFERICLESDIHLAEVAACHSILVEQARAPGDSITAASRGRLLAAVKRAQASPAAAAIPADQPDAAPLRPESGGASRTAKVGAAGSARQGVPVGAWLSAGVAVALLVLLAGMLVRMIRPAAVARREEPAVVAAPDPGREPAAEKSAAPVEAVAAAAPAAGVATELVPGPATDEEEMPSAPPAEPPAAPATPPEPAVAAAIPDATAGDGAAARDAAAGAAGAAPGDPAAGAPNAGGVAAPVGPVPLPVMEADPPPAEPPVVAAAADGVFVGDGPLLHRVAAGGGERWEPLGAGQPLAAVEQLAVPAHAAPELRIGDIVLRLSPLSLAAISRDADGTPRIEIAFGRCLAVAEGQGGRLGVSAGGLVGVVTLAPRQPAGIDVELTRDTGVDPAVVPPGRRVSLVTSGNATWRQTEADGGPPGAPLAGIDLETKLAAGAPLAWNAAEPAAAVVGGQAAPPAWLGPPPRANRLDASAAAALAAALRPGESAEDALRGLAADRRVENRLAAATTLALLGSYDEAVGLLSEEARGAVLRDWQWTRLEAEAVQRALARGANAAGRLRKAFEARGPAGRGEDLLRLAIGFTDADLAAGGAATLVGMLEDPALVVRRYADHDLAGIVAFGDKPPPDYRPDRAAEENRDGVRRWRELLEAGGVRRPATP